MSSMAPFDDDLSEAYAALAQEAKTPFAYRLELIQRYKSYFIMGAAALVVVGIIATGAMYARNRAAHVVPTPTDSVQLVTDQQNQRAQQDQMNPTADTRTPTGQGAPIENQQVAPGTNPAPGSIPGAIPSASAQLSTPTQVSDLAIRYAFIWANQGGGLDPVIRAKQLAAMRGVPTPDADPAPANPGMQVVVSAHVGAITQRDQHYLVTVSLLLAGAQAPAWANVQVPIGPSGSTSWVVLGDPVWVPVEHPESQANPDLPEPKWVMDDSAAHHARFSTFFSQYGAQPMVNDHAIVAKPLAGLGGLVQFDGLDGIATTANPNHFLVRVRWANAAGIHTRQVYRLTLDPKGGIDSVEVGVIQ